MKRNIKLVKKLPKAKGFSSIMYPGERKNKAYRKNFNKDITIPSKILSEMNKLNAISPCSNTSGKKYWYYYPHR